MTVHVCRFERHAVTIVSDTLQVTPSYEPFAFSTKVQALPHISVGFACCGRAVVVEELFLGLRDAFLPNGIDDLDVQALADDTLTALHRVDAKFGYAPGDMNIWLFGWSRAIAGFRMIECTRLTKYVAFDRKPGSHNLPHFDHGVPPFPEGTMLTDDKLVLTAAMFCDAVNQSVVLEHGPGSVGAGGELVMTRLTPGGMEQRKVRRFKDYETLKERMPDVRSAFIASAHAQR